MNTDASLMYKSIKKTTREKRMAGRFSNVDDCFCFSHSFLSLSHPGNVGLFPCYNQEAVQVGEMALLYKYMYK